MNDLRAALEELRKLYPPKPKENYFVHIDDLLSILRALRKLGYKSKRVHKKAIWLIIDPSGYSYIELYIDVTRSIQRGVILIVPEPTWKREITIDPPSVDLRAFRRYSR